MKGSMRRYFEDEELELNIDDADCEDCADCDDYEPGEDDEELELMVEEEPDVRIKKSGLRDYWNKYKSIDPVLKNYSSFDDWAKDSVENGYVYDDEDEELELVDEGTTYGDTARAYDVARYCYDQGMSDREAVREIKKQLSDEGSVVPADRDIWYIVDGVYEGDSEYVDEAYTINVADVAPLDDYSDQINEYIQNHPDKPIMWRLYKENVILPWVGYKIIDVPDGAVSRTVDLLNEMPLISEKGAKVTMTPYGNDEWAINVRWKEQDAEPVTESTRDFIKQMNDAKRALKSEDLIK